VPWICYNGAEIRQDGRVLYRNFIPEGALVELVPRVLEEFPDTIVGIELDDVLWLNRPRERQTSYHPRYRIADLRDVAHHATAKVLFFSERREALLHICDPLPPATRLMTSGRYPFFQLMAESADKVHALSFLLDGWGYGLRDVVAFGDDINDVDLLRACGVGVAVANAFPGALAVADRVTASNEEDGVALVLEELLAE
jgi:hydroxymethylpyrimidine pyrophosphatase-like HAD family hydrolase